MVDPTLDSPETNNSQDHHETFQEHQGDDKEDFVEEFTSLLPPSLPSEFADHGKAEPGKNTNQYQLEHIRNIKSKFNNRDSATMTLIEKNPFHRFQYERNCNADEPEAYFVKDVQVIAPHLQINQNPHCPTCCKVARTKSWTDGDPVKCYGVEDYYLLLSFRYHCDHCNKSFNSLHPKSIEQLDNNFKIQFNFFLLNKSCVDRLAYKIIEELFATLGKGGLHSLFEKLYKSKYDEVALIYHADLRQSLEAGHENKKGADGDLKKAFEKAKGKLTAASEKVKNDRTMKLREAVTLFWTKQGFRLVNHGLTEIKGIGDKVKDFLKMQGIGTVEKLAASKSNVDSLVKAWESKGAKAAQSSKNRGQVKSMVSAWVKKGVEFLESAAYTSALEKGEAALNKLRKELADAEAEAEEEGEALVPENAANVSSGNNNNINNNNNNNKLAKNSEFPSFWSMSGNAGKTISERSIYACAMDFLTRYEDLHELLLTSETSDVLSLDETFDFVKRVFIYHKNGARSTPYKSILTVYSGNRTPVGWYGMTEAESHSPEKRQVLRNIAERYVAAGKTLQIMFTDSCCRDRQFLKQLFGNQLEVQLDSFHYEMRWVKGVALAPAHKLCRLFCRLMSRAMYDPDPDEMAHAKNLLAAQGNQNPTYTELLKLVKIKKPASSVEQEKRVREVIKAFMDLDAAQFNKMQTNQPCTAPIFFNYNVKSNNNIHKVIERQVKHIRIGCCSSKKNHIMYVNEHERSKRERSEHF